MQVSLGSPDDGILGWLVQEAHQRHWVDQVLVLMLIVGEVDVLL